MIRIYLDNMIYTYLRVKCEEKHKKLDEKLKELEPYVTIVYSKAHISDLLNKYDPTNEKIKERTSNDLETIQNVTQTHCIKTELNKPSATGEIINPYTLFNSMYNSKGDVYNFDAEMDAILNDATIPEEIRKPLEAYLSTPLSLITQGVTHPILTMIFGNGPTLKDAISHILRYLDEVHKNPEKMKALNKMATEGMALGTHINMIRDNIFPALDSLINKKYKTTLTEMMDVSLKHQKGDKEATDWDRFLNAFSFLNIIGYKTDSLGNGYGNYLNDLDHAYFGAYCDFFITEDDKTYLKAKGIYEKEKIYTEACKIEEFLEIIGPRKFNISSTVEFFKECHHHIKESIPCGHHSTIDTKTDVRINQLKNKMLCYFNTVQVHTTDGKRTIHFKRYLDNYSTFWFTTEIAKLVNCLSTALGKDVDGKEMFNADVEMEELAKKTWSGRIWLISTNMIVLSFKDGEVYPTLSIFDCKDFLITDLPI